jgi:hypothetical protein
MGKLKAGQLTLLAPLTFSLWAIANHFRSAHFGNPSTRAAYDGLLGPFPIMPYMFAAALIPYLLVTGAEPARRAVARIFVLFMVLGSVWWVALALPVDGGGVARFCWFLVQPALWIVILYAPSVSHFINLARDKGHPGGVVGS